MKRPLSSEHWSSSDTENVSWGVREREEDTYETAWGISAYHTFSPGEALAPLFFDMASPKPDDSVLDAGCGAGKGALALHARGLHDIRLCDITEVGLDREAAPFPFYPVCLWDDLSTKLGYLPGGKVDWVYCCDVMEHIPTPFTMLVISRLLAVARKGVFLSISLVPDQFGVWVGKPLHQTVQSFLDWKEQLHALGHVREARDLLNCGLYLVEPRC